jgi:hypothetical protein
LVASKKERRVPLWAYSEFPQKELTHMEFVGDLSCEDLPFSTRLCAIQKRNATYPTELKTTEYNY